MKSAKKNIAESVRAHLLSLSKQRGPAHAGQLCDRAIPVSPRSDDHEIKSLMLLARNAWHNLMIETSRFPGSESSRHRAAALMLGKAVDRLLQIGRMLERC